ncbi:MAG: SagB/ThcOx family dehydrogenase [Chromatiaceae bacterium]|nr:SagB/ThcOx family dehydrogenase [Chromatiaceae bacterium]
MSSALHTVRAYHRATKHHRHAFAPGPGFLDWDSQPDPFRRFVGAPLMPLPLIGGRGRCSYEALYEPGARSPQALSPESLGLMLELALGLSAWKVAGSDRWALRNNPSSGNLHPTEGYLLLWQSVSPELGPGLYHYAPREHALECRALLSVRLADELAEAQPGSFGALGLSSIIWREAWKYGARAYRYCQHDVGHALAAARFAAAVPGWTLMVDTAAGDDEVAACLGLDRRDDFGEAEPEHPDLLALFGVHGFRPAVPAWTTVAEALGAWTGRANRLSTGRVGWPQIDQLLPAIHKPRTISPAVERPLAGSIATTPGRRDIDACDLIRQRRSVQRMDGHSGMSRAAFERALQRTLPSSGRAPFDALPSGPALDLVLFVHAVHGLEPGLYALIRTAGNCTSLRNACMNDALDWTALDDTALPLYRLKAPVDLRHAAARLSCDQDIAGDGAFAVAMLADIAEVLAGEGAWAYRRLYWEAGMIGQVLYLEAEAAGLRGTGIGCFFDDEVHRLLGLDTTVAATWQSLYHFTVGLPLSDDRLTSEPPYAHLADRGRR